MKRCAIQIADLGFGDSGKGTMVDFLARQRRADLVVRFNGGPQAGHNVVLPDGRHHTFAQFGSASFVPGVRTLLSRFMLVEPYALLNEAAHLEAISGGSAIAGTFVDERALVITPPQQIANRIRERARGDAAHGTCGQGIGECVADSIERPELTIRAGDLLDDAAMRRRLHAILEYKRNELRELRSFATPDERHVLDEPRWIDVALDVYAEVARRVSIVAADVTAAMVREAECIIFEGAQGVLLDECFGFHPHTTWSTTTIANADTLLDECGSDAGRQRIGVIRTYLTRHGAGPFVTENDQLCTNLPEPHNTGDGWQGKFRRGTLDLVMLRYALAACGRIDGLAVTHVDRLAALPNAACCAYELDGASVHFLPLNGEFGSPSAEALGLSLRRARPQYRPWPTANEEAFVAELATEAGLPVLYRSRGPTWREKT